MMKIQPDGKEINENGGISLAGGFILMPMFPCFQQCDIESFYSRRYI